MSVFLLFVLLLLVLVNGFFVAAEFALVRSRRSKMEQLAEGGERGAKAGRGELAPTDKTPAPCQGGIPLASIGIGFLGEPSLARLLEPILGGAISHGAAVAISV